MEVKADDVGSTRTHRTNRIMKRSTNKELSSLDLQEEHFTIPRSFTKVFKVPM